MAQTPLSLHQDPSAWDELIESLNPRAILVLISSWMGERLRRHFTAEDVWQETLAMAWRDRDQFTWQGRPGYRAWILKIARNRVHDLADHVEAKKRGGDRRVDRFSSLVADMSGTDAGRVSALFPEGSTTPSRVAGHGEEALALEQALRELPAELELVVRPYLLEEVPLREVAENLGIGLSTAKRRAYRGAALLRTKVRERLGRPPAPREGGP